MDVNIYIAGSRQACSTWLWACLHNLPWLLFVLEWQVAAQELPHLKWNVTKLLRRGQNKTDTYITLWPRNNPDSSQGVILRVEHEYMLTIATSKLSPSWPVK